MFTILQLLILLQMLKKMKSMLDMKLFYIQILKIKVRKRVSQKRARVRPVSEKRLQWMTVILQQMLKPLSGKIVDIQKHFKEKYEETKRKRWAYLYDDESDEEKC